MANFDTASKRFSGMQMGETPTTTLPVPDGTVSAGDRLHFMGLYSGIAAASIAVSNKAIALVGSYVRSLSLIGAYVRSQSFRGSF